MEKWIITCNPNYYDVIGVFKAFDKINWKQSVNVQVGDIVYIYVGKPYSSINFETKVIAVDLPEAGSYDSEYVIDGTNFEDHGRYMELQLLRAFDIDLLPYDELKANGLKSVQGPSRVSSELEKFIINKASQLKQIDTRRYFFVFQNKSYNEESKGEYLWAPQYGENERKVSHWDQMREIRKGDLIIHSYLKEIVAISIAKVDVYESDRPTAKGVHDEWNSKGWRVDTEYYTIANPIVTSDHMDMLLKLQPETRAPFNRLGRGNTGYLFTANRKMAVYIIKKSAANQSSDLDRKLLLGFLKDSEVQIYENKLDQELIDEIDKMQNQIRESNIPYKPEPVEKPEAIIVSGKISYSRDRQVAINALNRANHQCEINPKHPSFVRKSINTNYVEPHHLIPMAYQDLFKNSLDVEANIVSLCSNCHNHIHYGLEASKLIKQLYEKRKDELELAGIAIGIEDLLKLYN